MREVDLLVAGGVKEMESLHARVTRWFEPLRDPAAADGWQLTDWETEQGITLWLAGPGSSLSVEIERADPSRPCFARTERFNLYFDARRALGGAAELSPVERAVLDRVVDIVRAHEGELPPPPSEEPQQRVQIREIQAPRALVEERPGAYYVNPYVGCLLGCPFCYAIHRADFSRALEGSRRAEWGRWVDVKVNLPEVLAREVRERPPGTVRLSPIVTDPYQPIERTYRITRRCLEVLAGTAFVPVVLTRSSLVLGDLDVLRACEAPLVGLSVPTDDDAVRAELEPRTEPIERRISTLRSLHEAGIATFAVVQPMLPLDPDALVRAVSPWVRAVRIGPLFEKARVALVYERMGRSSCLGEDWERRTHEALRKGFEARGVLVDSSSPPWSVLA